MRLLGDFAVGGGYRRAVGVGIAVRWGWVSPCGGGGHRRAVGVGNAVRWGWVSPCRAATYTAAIRFASGVAALAARA